MGHKIRSMTLTGLALASLAGSLAGCAVYAPAPRRVAYVAPAPVVFVRPCCARVVIR